MTSRRGGTIARSQKDPPPDPFGRPEHVVLKELSKDASTRPHTHTSYMYSLGFPANYHKDDECELWARHMKYEASELFTLVSELVGRWAVDLRKKAMGKKK